MEEEEGLEQHSRVILPDVSPYGHGGLIEFVLLIYNPILKFNVFIE